ncbi:MAG: cytochrome c [Verrucomicrobiota bacterium]
MKKLMATSGSAGLVAALFLGLAPLGAQTPAPTTPAPTPPPVAPASAPTPPAAKAAAPRSVWDGAFSKDQAGRGLKAYNSLCTRCHGDNLLGNDDASALVGKEFLDNWRGKSVGSLIEETRKKMPSDGPGKLSRQQCTDVTAYLLSANGFPAGSGDLATDLEITNQILITDKK